MRWRIGEKLTEGLRDAFYETGAAAILRGVGPMPQIMFTRQPAIHDYREFRARVDGHRCKRLALALFKYGVYMTPSASLHSIATQAHTDEEVVFTLDAVRKVLTEVND